MAVREVEDKGIMDIAAVLVIEGESCDRERDEAPCDGQGECGRAGACEGD